MFNFARMVQGTDNRSNPRPEIAEPNNLERDCVIGDTCSAERTC